MRQIYLRIHRLWTINRLFAACRDSRSGRRARSWSEGVQDVGCQDEPIRGDGGVAALSSEFLRHTIYRSAGAKHRSRQNINGLCAF